MRQTNPLRPRRSAFPPAKQSEWALLFGYLVLALAGCESTEKEKRQPAKYPQDTLRVRYESAESYSTCLVASISMSANYVLGKREFSEESIRTALKSTGRDETLVADLKAYLAEQGLHLITLTGRIDGKPPVRLGYWVQSRGYPVICIINRDPESDPGFNHAVVVIGISANPEDGAADKIHYFDPSAPQPLQSDPVARFQTFWGRCDRAMMIVVAPPSDT
jgi:hypothetical protein